MCKKCIVLPCEAKKETIAKVEIPLKLPSLNEYPLIGIKAAIIDGEKLKADTFYKLQDGEFVEVEEDSKWQHQNSGQLL